MCLAPNLRKDRRAPPIPTERRVRSSGPSDQGPGSPRVDSPGGGREAWAAGSGRGRRGDVGPCVRQVRQRISSLLQEAKTQAALVLDRLEGRQA